MRVRTVVAYSGAAITLMVAACVPFVLMGLFTHLVAGAGLRIDPAYSGGTVARVLPRSGYRIIVDRPVYPRALQRIDPFVQIAFTPASALPRQVDEWLNLGGGDQPEVRVTFTVPADPHARPTGSVTALNAKYKSFAMPGSSSFSQMIVQSGGAVVIRVPLAKRSISVREAQRAEQAFSESPSTGRVPAS